MGFSASRVADTIATILARHGLSVNRRGSNISSSRYILVDRIDPVSEDFAGPEVKVRIATHSARPTYERINGAAQIEVGTHEHACTDNAHDAALRVLRRYAIAPDKPLATVIARQLVKAETARIAARAVADERSRIFREQEAETARLDTILVERGYDRAVIGGKKWREKRADLRRQEGKAS